MPFTNPIVGGTELIIESIKSPNYETGVTGWSINRDGTSEFANATVRGTFIAGPLASRTVINEDGISVRDYTVDPGDEPTGVDTVTGVNMPTELSTHYENEDFTLGGGHLYYSHATNAYWYDAVAFNFTTSEGIRVSGRVLNGTVTEISRVGNGTPPPLSLRERQRAVCDSPSSPTSTTWSDVSGCTISVETTAAIVQWEAFYHADFQQIGGSNTTTVVRLLEDGSAGSHAQCIFNPGNTSTAGPTHRIGGVTQSADGIWTPGTHEVKLQTHRADGVGTNRVNSVHTNLYLKLYY